MKKAEHAKRGLIAAGYKPVEECEDGPSKWIQENVLELPETLSKQDHSGSSIHLVTNLFQKLALFKPLSPLTGSDDEWNDIGDGEQQNKRCSHVFRKNGVAYTLYGYSFWHWSSRPLDEDGEGYPGTRVCKLYFNSGHGWKLVNFPYTPEEPEQVEVECYEVNQKTLEPEPGSGWWHTVYPEHVEANYIVVRAALGQG